MEILTVLFTIILPLLIGFILGQIRDNNKIIFNRKLEIYSNIISHLSSGKFLRVNLDISREKAKSIISEINHFKTETASINKYIPLNEEPEDLEKKVNELNYRDELIGLFSPARLIGDKDVTEELREVFHLVCEFYEHQKEEGKINLRDKISQSVMELEQLMRIDLGCSRILSKVDIYHHIYKVKIK